MAPPKGTSGNPKGRPKGRPNKVTAELKDRIKGFLDDNFQDVADSFKKLEPEKKILLYEKFLGYRLPKQKESDVNISISKLSDTEVDQLLNRLLSE